MAFDFEAGEVLLIDKPLEWTSFDVVRKIRNSIKIKKVGHAGTLDPLATGLLIICTGKKTKSIDLFQAAEKEYTGQFCIGATTPSFDLETTVEEETNVEHITENQIIDVAQSLTGIQYQIPPMYSAVQVDGVRLYKLARKGEQIKVEPRQVEIFSFEITKIELPQVHFRISCSKGTYIRSIARDFGLKLGVGAYLSSLRRTKIGDFTVENAMKIEDFLTLLKSSMDNNLNHA